MLDFARAREFMVDNQLRTSGITDWRILAQMSTVPREQFVEKARQPLAYIDDVQWFGQPGNSRFLSSPATFAKLVQIANIAEHDAVLDIGCATGYSTAVMAGLCRTIVGLEEDGDLAAYAQSSLQRLGISNAQVLEGDIDMVGQRQFDVVMVEGAMEKVPESYFAVLNEGGRLVVLLRKGAVAVANVYIKAGASVTARPEFNAQLPLLVQAQPEAEFVF